MQNRLSVCGSPIFFSKGFNVLWQVWIVRVVFERRYVINAMSSAERNLEEVSMSKLLCSVSSATNIFIPVIMLFVFVVYTVAILKLLAQMMSSVDLPFLNTNCVRPINSSAASCFLLRVRKDRIFHNAGTMQIGLRFSGFGVLGIGVWGEMLIF